MVTNRDRYGSEAGKIDNQGTVYAISDAYNCVWSSSHQGLLQPKTALSSWNGLSSESILLYIHGCDSARILLVSVLTIVLDQKRYYVVSSACIPLCTACERPWGMPAVCVTGLSKLRLQMSGLEMEEGPLTTTWNLACTIRKHHYKKLCEE